MNSNLLWRLSMLTLVLCFCAGQVLAQDEVHTANDVGLDPGEGEHIGNLEKSAATVVFSGSTSPSDPTTNRRIYRDGNPSNCQSQKTWPNITYSGTFRYDVYTLRNCGPVAQCVTVTQLWSGTAYLHTVMYEHPFNPNNIYQNIMGDVGSSSNGWSFGVTVPGNTTVDIVITDVYSYYVPYILIVDGLDTDLIPPSLTVPPDITLNNAPGQCGVPAYMVNLGQAVYSDNRPGATVSNNAPAFYPVGTTNVVWTATDACGNTTTAVQNVTILDVEPPALWVILWPQFLMPPNQQMRTITAFVSATDNCPNVDWRLDYVLSSHPDAGTFVGDLPGDIVATTGQSTTSFSVRAENSPGYGSRVYYVRYSATDQGNRTVYSNGAIAVQYGSGGLIFSDDDFVPATMELLQNYPNPFSGTTSFTFRLPEDTHASLRIYDMLGREVAVATEGDFIAGSHSMEFDGSSLPEGVYLFKLVTGNDVLSKKMLIVR